MTRRKSAIAILTAGLMWGLSSLFVRPLGSEFGLTGIQIYFAKISIATLIYTIFIAIKDPSKFKIRLKDLWMFLGAGLLGCTALNFCYFTLMMENTSASSVFMGMAPIFVVIFSVILFKETITPLKITALCLAILGCLFTSGILGNGTALTVPMIFLGIGISLCKASYTIFSRYARKDYDALTVTWYAFLIGCLATIPFADVPATVTVLFTNGKALLLASILAVCCTIIPYFLYSYGLKNTKPGRSIMLAATEPLTGCLIGMLVFKEDHGFFKILGVGMILLCLILLGMQGFKNKKE